MSEHDQNNETIAWKNGAEAANGGWRDDPRVTAYALGELEALDEESIAAIAGAIARDPELRQYVEDLRATGETLCVGLGATESSSVKGGRLASALSAEALMAAAFEDEAPTQTVSTVSEKPHAAAGSGRRAREATRPAPSPFRRYFALGAVAATLVISVLVGLLVASYGQMSPSSSVAVDMPTPAQDQAASNTLDLDTALEFQIGKFKAGNGITIDGVHNDANLSADVQENLSVQHEKLGAFIASVTDAADAQPGSGSATSSSGGTSSGAGWMGAEVNMETAVAPRAAVIQRHNQKISELLEEVDRVTDENLKIGEERLQTSLAWAPEKYRTEDAVDLQINSSPNTIEGTWHLMNEELGKERLEEEADPVAPYHPASPELTYSPGPPPPPERTEAAIASGWYRWAEHPQLIQGLSREVASRSDGSFRQLDLGIRYGDASRRPGPPLADSTATADAKPEAEIAETKKTTDAPKPGILEKGFPVWEITSPEGIIKTEIAKLEGQIAQKKETVKKAPTIQGGENSETAEIRQLREDLRQLREQLAKEQKTNAPAVASIGSADTVVEDKYGPNAGVTTKEGKLTMGGLVQTWFYTIQNDNVAVGISRDSGINLNDVYAPQEDNDGFAIRRGQLRFDMETQKRIADSVIIGEEGIRDRWYNARDINNANWAVAYGLMSKEDAWRNTRGSSRHQEIVPHSLHGLPSPDYFLSVSKVSIEDAYAQYHGVTPHHDFNFQGFNFDTGYRSTQQHWADQFRAYHPAGVLEEISAVSDFYVATGYRLTDNLWADRGSTRGLWTRGEWSGARSPATPAPEAPGGMVIWHFNAADPARGQNNDRWRLTRIGGRFSDMMSSLDDYRIGGAFKDGGLALLGVDGEFDHGRMGYVAPHPDEGRQTESYAVVNENPFEKARTISTFSIDVDTASYSNVRRWLNDNQLPPLGAVRYEELINYFRYAYEPPPSDAKEPFATHIEVATCPWNAAHRLVRIALKGREIDPNSRPSSNLVFLVDVSGSMGDANKLDLVRQGLNLLVDNLNARDRVAIVTYSDTIKVELESTPCDQKRRILERINALNAGGSTNGGDGIQKAYAIAAKNHIAGGTNRVILCTDGDFNVGTTSNDELVKLIEKQAKSGVFLSVLGFGMGNYKDDKLEAIADKGNGHYAYIDSFQEAKKVFGQELAGTLVTIAKDVKVQVEFNPATAHSYRLIGYENRLMRKEDFADDTKDAGEIGAGHAVTALYEVIPAGTEEAVQPVRVPLDVLLLNAKPEEVAKLTFIWKQTGGPKADLRDADRPNAYFLPTADGEYEFEVSAVADANVIKTTVKRTVKLAELAAPKAPAERASRYLEEAKVKEDAKTSGELLTVWLRYKQPEEDKSTELSVPVRDGGKKLEQSSPDFRFASSVAAFGMLLRGSVYAKNLNWDFVLELAGESKGADAEGQRAEFIDLAKKAKALSGK